ncbi:MAG: hypothetical protein WC223_13410 [Bacteroidales bacterium]|jgi:hypothetical protein
MEKAVKYFLQTEEIDFENIKDSPDGRITAGHFALLKKMKNEGLIENLICFDEKIPTGKWNERDADMANNIIENLSKYKTLVVAGNIHTETKPIIFDNEKKEHHPMGEKIIKKIPNVPSGKIKYITGEFYNYGKKKFKKKPEDILLQKAKFHKTPEGKYIFELPKAHAAVVPDTNSKIK